MSELYHYGVLGMKWGIRRYQNYDGSYTKKGVQNAKKSLQNYEQAKQLHKQVKGLYKETKRHGYVTTADGSNLAIQKSTVNEARTAKRKAKFRLKRDYKQLKKDRAGDIGKNLYNRGKTITGTRNKLYAASMIAGGTFYVAKMLNENGNRKAAEATVMAGLGLEAITAVLASKGAVEAHYLRSYYGHSRPKD